MISSGFPVGDKVRYCEIANQRVMEVIDSARTRQELLHAKTFHSSQQVLFLIGQLRLNPLVYPTLDSSAGLLPVEVKRMTVCETGQRACSLLFLMQPSEDELSQNLSRTPLAAKRIRE